MIIITFNSKFSTRRYLICIPLLNISSTINSLQKDDVDVVKDEAVENKWTKCAPYARPLPSLPNPPPRNHSWCSDIALCSKIENIIAR